MKKTIILIVLSTLLFVNVFAGMVMYNPQEINNQFTTFLLEEGTGGAFQDGARGGVVADTITSVNGAAFKTTNLLFGRKTVDFDGTSYLRINDSLDLALGSIYTVQVWMYVDAFIDGDYLYSQREDSAEEVIFGMGSPLGMTYWAAETSNTFFVQGQNNDDLMSTGQWYHWAFSQDGVSANVYIGGQKVSPGLTTFTAPAAIINYAAFAYINGLDLGAISRQSDMKIFGFKFDKRRLYKQNFRVPTRPL